MKMGSRPGKISPSGVSQTMRVEPRPMLGSHKEVNAGLTQEQVELILAPLAEELKKLKEEPKPQSMSVPQLQVLEQKVVERTEVSVITKDSRARQYSKALRSKLAATAHRLSVVSSIQDSQVIDIENLQKLVSKLQEKQVELEKREAAIEAIIPEENQEVTKTKGNGLLYLGVTAAILLSLLSLIIK